MRWFAINGLVACWFLVPQSPSFAQQVSGVERETLRTTAPVQQHPPPDLKLVVNKIRQQTNQFRKSQQLSAVDSDPELAATAQYFAQFMAEKDQYGHHADDRTPAERANQHDYQFCLLSENIAYVYGARRFTADELASEFVVGWKNSPEHRKNMLDPDVHETGVAVAHSAQTGHFYAVQMFGRPKSAAIQFEVVNQSPVTVHYQIRKNDFVLEPRYTRVHELCRPSDLVFRGKDPESEAEKTVLQPTTGDVLVVADDGRVEVER